MKLGNSLRATVSVWLFVVLAAALLPFVLLLVKFSREDLQAATSRHVVQIAQMVVKSTRLAMLHDDRAAVTQIISDLSLQPGIERLRLIDAEGEIIDSNHTREVGYSVDKREEPCLHCHSGDKPQEHVPLEKRWRIIDEPRGQRAMIAMEIIRNEPSCTSASCHEHKADQKVLGVVDITYSLADVDRSVTRHTATIGGLWLGFVLVLASGAGWLLQRKIYRPLRELEAGAARIRRGDLDRRVPDAGSNEFARVGTAFNSMSEALRASRADAAQLIRTLESRVEERSRQLLAARAEAARGEKLASIGTLASGIAHELNNPLTGVLTFTTLLRKNAAEGSQDAEDLDLVIRETRRCAGIIKRLLDFAREKVPVTGHFDLNAVISDTVRFVERSASLERVEIGQQLDPALPEIYGDADLIKQVVLNLLVNAQQAIDGPGRIDVATRVIAARDGHPPQVEIAVSDTGCGISAEDLTHIFDPFFTTKEVGKGTGLGLSVSYGIIHSHGGTIEVDSTVGVGTTFRVRLPVGHDAAPAPAAAPATPAEARP
ncbi:MAG: ATP-binding protein [Steroidobacteraceae bacterium]